MSQKLLTEDIRKKIPPLYSQENVKDPIVHVKFFTPWTQWTWYATEFDGKDIFFGWVVGLEKELGYFSLSEMESVRGPAGLMIERDRYFDPKPLSEVMADHGERLLPQVRKPQNESKKRPLYPHTPKRKEPLFPHVPGGRQPVEKLPQTLPQTEEKLYQRGPDGYPIGADKIMRDAWGPIPDPDQPFWSGKGFIKPVKIYGWQWSTDYHSWRAYVRFPDGTETWTSPLKQTGSSLELLSSTEGDPIRKFCCRQCGECAPKELLEEGRFLDRISWLRSHYKDKHPGMWGKMSPMTVEDGEPVSSTVCKGCGQQFKQGEKVVKVIWGEDYVEYYHEDCFNKKFGEPVSPEYRHLASLVREPLPKEAD